MWFVIDFLNPITLSQDMIGSINKITRLIVIGAFDIIFGLIKYGLNIIIKPVLGSGNLMGWDEETYPESDGLKKRVEKRRERNVKRREAVDKHFDELDKFDDVGDNNDIQNGGDLCDGKGQKKCYKTKPGEIPISILIMTVLCPPIGIFMQYGLSYWINIIICAMLSLAFYFPGLFYALLLLYT